MTSLADGLPPEVAKLVRPEWRANEAAYWQARPELLRDYQGQWVAFAGGRVISSGPSAVDVLHAAAAAGGFPYVARVGAEDEPCPMRRAVFAYDTAYQGEPLPVLVAEFRPASGVSGVPLDQVIVDTGADATALPWADCQMMGIDPQTGVPARIGGVGGGSAATLMFAAFVWLDGQEFRCRPQADFGGSERILGRDVLNRVDVLFRGPAREVVVNP